MTTTLRRRGATAQRTPSGTVLWAGTADVALNFAPSDPIWGYLETVGTSAPVRVTTPVTQGSHSLRFINPSGAARCEVIPIGDLTDGQTRYFGFSIYLDPGWTFESATWGRVLAQWRYNGYDSSPPLSLQVMEGAFWKIHGDPSGTDISDSPTTAYTTSLGSASADPGTWVRWVFGIFFKAASGTTKAGWVRIWKNGVEVLPQTALKTLYMQLDGVTPWTSSLKLGCYRSTSIAVQDTVYHDDWRMGTTYASVA